MFDTIFTKRTCKTRRESSYDTAGGNADRILLNPGESHTIAIRGCGIIKHIWATLGPKFVKDYRSLRIGLCFDDAAQPQVDMSIADFFGFSHGHLVDIDSFPIQVIRTKNHPNPQMNLPPYNGGVNCYFPMPFSKSAEITFTNLDEVPKSCYFHIDWEEYDSLPKDAMYFFATFNEQTVTPGADAPLTSHNAVNDDLRNLSDRHNYVLLDVDGYEGHYIGTSLFVDMPPDSSGRWWEGDEMFKIDGEPWPPRIHGTGTEDYFGLAYGFRVVDCRPYHGITFVEKGEKDINQVDGRFAMYRYHFDAPIAFNRSLRATLEHGHANDSNGYYRSVAYWYGRSIKL